MVPCTLQNGQSHSVKMCTPSCIGRSSRLNVVAFREDRNDYSVQKRGKQAQVGGFPLFVWL